MTAPFNNKNHLIYNPEIVKDILLDAILVIKNNQKVFNFPQLHREIGLQTLRTLPYLKKKYGENNEIKKLWDLLMVEMAKNQQIHIHSSYNKN